MVRITAITENTSSSCKFGAEHGLSLYIETSFGKYLFDMGGSDLFLRNARTLGLSIAEADAAFLSHGHYDHGGGLPYFLNENDHAPVYVSRHAFEEHLGTQKDGSVKYIGLPKQLDENLPRFIKLDGDTKINEHMTVLAGASGKEFFSTANRFILMRDENGAAVPDDFRHEQSLVIEDGGRSVLIAGCAHSGIVNILRKFEEKFGTAPDLVIGGFHLSAPAVGGSEPNEIVDGVAERLLSYEHTDYFTCHCTGSVAYGRLREKMGERIEYLSVGGSVTL